MICAYYLHRRWGEQGRAAREEPLELASLIGIRSRGNFRPFFLSGAGSADISIS
jgi:hypothetical protein